MSLLAAIVAVPVGVVRSITDEQHDEMLGLLAAMSESEQNRIYELVQKHRDKWPKPPESK